MAETEDKPVLPGNKGQFGAGDATEAFKPLEDHPGPQQSSAKQPHGGGQTRTEAGERS